jgi:hypothetical protein
LLSTRLLTASIAPEKLKGRQIVLDLLGEIRDHAFARVRSGSPSSGRSGRSSASSSIRVCDEIWV